ncbi:sulfurtransferase [Litoribrevibacter albus]|uniref:Rhodanese domain-containing protein n=1 Tax=Litoribrevibacter albus TaxID=1473156 RepID=A0AA37S8R8_9GAMM|nr:rhodanese-like domain-containing protein [Litoribrevibacter albus]GLQ30623.1 hypothetical protein GCM10007876_11010 [Litoribrevibacter albus]
MADAQPLLPLILDPKDLNEAIQTPALASKLIIVDLSTQELYDLGHIPGAVYIDHKRLTCAQPPAPGRLPSLEQLSQLMSDIGLTDESHVVVYDHEGGPWAGRFIWTLDLLGHPNSSFLNGGRDAWMAEKFDLSNDTPDTTPSNYTAELVNPDCRATKEEILSELDNIPNSWAIWDARSQDEHNGTKVLAARGGHIPNATHLEWTDTLNKSDNNKLLPLPELEKLLNKKGLTKDKTIVSHCQTHRRSGLTYLVAKALGYQNNKAYDGSWSEWGNDPDTPIEPA